MESVFMIFAFFVSLFLSFFLSRQRVGLLLDRTVKEHAVHSGDVPRVGGLAIFLSFLPAFYILARKEGNFFLVAVTAVFLVGFLEDLLKGIRAGLRLFFVFLVSGAVLYRAGVDCLGVEGLPSAVCLGILSFSIAGYTNGVNIVDGLNGLASGISAIFLAFLGLSFKSAGFPELASACFVVTAGILGFFVFNFLTGKLFLGDGGAYLLGFLCGVLSARLLFLSPDVSLVFPIALGFYPVWETIFSMYRRAKKGKYPMDPDRLHLHTLLFLRKVKSNSRASLFLLLFNLAFCALAFVLRSAGIALGFLILAGIFLYLSAYRWVLKG